MRPGLFPMLSVSSLVSRRPAGFLRAGLCVCCGLAWALQRGEAIADDGAPVSPARVVVLFNGRDLSGLAPWLKDTKGSDPRQVFRVQDGLLQDQRRGQRLHRHATRATAIIT